MGISLSGRQPRQLVWQNSRRLRKDRERQKILRAILASLTLTWSSMGKVMLSKGKMTSLMRMREIARSKRQTRPNLSLLTLP